MQFKHQSVMLAPCIEGLAIKPGGVYLDGTAGGGGHSFAIAERLTTGTLLSLDQDADAIEAAKTRLQPFGGRVRVIRANFSEMDRVVHQQGFSGLDGILLDLGVSSYQIDQADRGFSYRLDAPLDMRMDQSASLTAYDIVNGYDAAKLEQLFYTYGEEKYTRPIVRAIVQARSASPIQTTGQLSQLIKQAVSRYKTDGHPAKRVFQALRIEVNDELGALQSALEQGIDLLNPGGRMVIITFHSLEDRLVKKTFAAAAKGCTCPKDLPVCVCGKTPRLQLINKKPITADAEELLQNPRSHSAKVRIAEKIEDHKRK